MAICIVEKQHHLSAFKLKNFCTSSTKKLAYVEPFQFVSFKGLPTNPLQY